MDCMKADLEEKIRKLEEDKHNMDISAGTLYTFIFYSKLVGHFACSENQMNSVSCTVMEGSQKLYFVNG